MLRTVPGRNIFSRTLDRGLKPTATIDGRYATKCAQRVLFSGQRMEQEWDKLLSPGRPDFAQARPTLPSYFPFSSAARARSTRSFAQALSR